MLSLDEFRVSRFYHPKALGMEDESQDPGDMRRMHRKDQEEQYARYVAQHEPESSNGATATEEEAKVAQQLSELTKTEVAQLVVQRNKGCATKKDAQWWRNYREGLRNKVRVCAHCGKDPRK